MKVNKIIMTKKSIIPTTGLEQLKAIRDETIQRWSKLGLLEGLQERKSNVFDFMLPNENQIIKEDPSQIVDKTNNYRSKKERKRLKVLKFKKRWKKIKEKNQ